MISSLQTFVNRLRYGEHTFEDGDVCFAAPHINPDGSIGGWVAETALVEPTCWLDPDAEVLEYAQVRDGARILGCAVISGFAVVAGKAIVNDWALVTEAAIVQGSAYVGSGAIICRESFIDHGNAEKDQYYTNLQQRNLRK